LTYQHQSSSAATTSSVSRSITNKNEKNNNIVGTGDNTSTNNHNRQLIPKGQEEKKSPPEPINSVNNSGNNADEEGNKNSSSSSPTKQIKMLRLPTGEQLTEEDQKFLDRIKSSLQTVQNWDNDTELFETVRSYVPWKELTNATGKYSKPEQDRLLVQSNALFLQRLCRWFPSFMNWVNTPPCSVCGCKDCEMKTVRGPETEEEKEGHAKRVEGKETKMMSIH
jgi:hypothetical protein